MQRGYRGSHTGRLLATIACTAALVACSGKDSPSARPVASTLPQASASAAPTATHGPVVAPASVHADELGAVPVLMYHQLVASPKGDYDQTPAQFRTELEQLYTHGYRTVTAADLVAGRIDIPAGKHPMVLTFDDSTVSQFGAR